MYFNVSVSAMLPPNLCCCTSYLGIRKKSLMDRELLIFLTRDSVSNIFHNRSGRCLAPRMRCSLAFWLGVGESNQIRVTHHRPRIAYRFDQYSLRLWCCLVPYKSISIAVHCHITLLPPSIHYDATTPSNCCHCSMPLFTLIGGICSTRYRSSCTVVVVVVSITTAIPNTVHE